MDDDDEYVDDEYVDDGYVDYRDEPWRPAVESGDLSELQDLVQEQGLAVLTRNYVNEHECAETTPLLEAVYRQHMDMVRYLLEECSSVVDINASSIDHVDYLGYTSLHFAAEHKNVELARCLVEKGCDVNAVDARGNTTLHRTVELDHVDIAKVLIDTGLCNLELETGKDIGATEATALMLAAGYFVDGYEWSKNLEIVQYLMEHGPWTDEEKADRATKALPAPCQSGDLEIAKYLVESCRADVNAHGSDDRFIGLTPLVVACENGCLEIVQYLVEKCNADVEVYSTDYQKLNPLLKACEYGYLEIIQYLIEKCHANLETARGRNKEASPLRLAIKSGKLDAVQYLLAKCPAEKGETALHAAVQSHKFGVVQFWVEIGPINIEATDSNGNTALHEAARYGSLDMVQLLVEKMGSIVEAKNSEQRTALHMACDSHCADAIAVVKYFVEERRVNVNLPTSQGETALHIVSKKRNVEMVQCLIQSGRIMNVNAFDRNGQTAMHSCLVHIQHSLSDEDDCLQIIKIFATVDEANFETRDKDGRTILHLACEKAWFEVVHYLVQECRVNVNTANNLGETASIIASRERSVAIVQCLTSLLHLNVNAADKNGRTALHFACSALVDEEQAMNNRLGRRGRHTSGDESNCCKIVQCLLKTGRVNVNAQDHQGKTALHHSFVNPIEIAPREPARQKYLQDACFKLVQLLVESGQANVDTRDHTGQTALHYYSSFPNLDIPRYLIEHAHANVEAVDHEGRTALHMAASNARGNDIRSGLRLVLFLVSRLSADVLGRDDDVVELIVPSLHGRDNDGHSTREESLPKRQRT
jgi:serine/threonine-protein phosphatase 6 regulatory ankyrin repeat subunit B